MAINWPSNPSVGDIYTNGISSWIWNGYAWNILANTHIGLTGPNGLSLSPTGPTGHTGKHGRSYLKYKQGYYYTFLSEMGATSLGSVNGTKSHIMIVEQAVTIDYVMWQSSNANTYDIVWGIYENHSTDLIPTNLLAQTSPTTNTAAAVYTAALSSSISLTAGLYWFVHSLSSGATNQSFQIQSAFHNPSILGQVSGNLNPAFVYWDSSSTYYSTLPSTWSFTNFNPATGGSRPFLGFRIASIP